MAVETLKLHAARAWWVPVALLLAYPLYLVSKKAADRYIAWLFDRGLTFRVG